VLLSYARGVKVDGVEIQPESASLCRENLRENGLDDTGVVCGDLRQHRELFTAGGYDLVVSNPPYFAENSGHTAPKESRAAARDERFCTLDDLCRAANYLCRWGGSFALVHRPERLSEIFCAMTKYGLEPKRLRMVQYKPGAAPNLVLVEARRGGKPSLNIQPPLILTDGQGQDCTEVLEIYHVRKA
jgi:tRNA1Val (adenine37-N6)-methyltransferase